MVLTIWPGPSGSPTSRSSSPVVRTMTEGRRRQRSEVRPAAAQTPITPGLTTRPGAATRSPARRSLPAARRLVPALTEARIRTAPSSSAVSSTRTTASAPAGTGAPVMIRIAVPACSGCGGPTPARTSPRSGRRTGLAGPAAATSWASTA